MAAARRATDWSTHADAARLYRRAIEAARAGGADDDHTALGETWEQLGEALRAVGEPPAAARAFSEARRLLRDDPIAQARLCDRQAEVAKRSAALTAAVRWLKRGFRAIETLDDPEAIVWRARLRSNLGGIRSRQGRWNETISVCRQAISEASSVGELRALAHACYVLDWALVETGRDAEATNAERALEIYRELRDPEHESMVLNNLGMLAYFKGRWEQAIALYRSAGECSERAGKPADTAYTDCNVGEILSDQGHLEEAETYLQRARRIWSSTGEQQGVAYVDLLLGRLDARRGDHSTGRKLLERSVAELHEFRVDAYTDFGRALIAEVEALEGDPLEALEIARRELQCNDRHRPLLTRVAGVALARSGQKEAAQAELRRSLRVARDRGSEYDIAAAIDALAALSAADAELLADRDQILDQLKVVRLVTPALM
jgi:tetratricopeptide (TPR) repeat protein